MVAGEESPPARVRVVHFVSSSTGGAGIAAKRLHEALCKFGGSSIESYYLTSEDAKGRYPSIPNSPIKSLEQLALGGLSKFLLALYRLIPGTGLLTFPTFVGTGIAQVIQDVKPDVLHVHWLGKSSLSFAELRQFGIPVVWTLHDSWLATVPEHVIREKSLRERALVRLLREMLKRVFRGFLDLAMPNLTLIFPSEDLRDRVCHDLPRGVTEAVVIPNTLDMRFWSKQSSNPIRAKHGFSDGDLIVTAFSGSTGDFGIKGSAQLPLIWAQLAKGSGHFTDRFRLVTFGSYEPLEGSLGDAHTHLGRLGRAELRDLMSAANVMIYPSMFDNFPNLVLEASSVGLPTVAFDTGGIREIFGSFANVQLVPRGDTFEMASRVARLLSDPESLTELGASLRLSIVERFSEDKIAELHKSLYLRQLDFS